MGKYNSQNLANTAWAFATVKHSDEKLFTVLARAVDWRLGEFNTQGLANTLWALATVSQSDGKLLAVLVREAK